MKISRVVRHVCASSKNAMDRSISLTVKEQSLQKFLLDVSSYIATQGRPKPELRFTGGWVRDKLLGSTSDDIDISINSMTGYEFGGLMKAFLDSSENGAKYKQRMVGNLAKIEANPEKSKHLETVTTKIMGLQIDLVNLRKEQYAEDSRNPSMEFGTPQNDADRRDATVNALFYNLQTSEVEDFTGRGLKDMDRKVLKTPLPAYQTFKDDPLRVLRSIRFASRLGFRIDPEDQAAMSDERIKEALRRKISRERVGAELGKMLRGPSPHMALSLIDRLNLYNVTFISPDCRLSEIADTTNWHLAYDQLPTMTGTQLNEISDPIRTIATALLNNPQDPEEVYLAWMLCCFVPWARTVPTGLTLKYPKTPAAIAASEGIKADKRITRIVEDAIINLTDVIKTRTNPIDRADPLPTTLKRKQPSADRELHGKALIRWGSHWRSVAIFALLVEISESANLSERQHVLEMYATWLSDLTRLGLLDVHRMKPIVSGHFISQQLGAKTGPWMKKALDIALGWQLRNPDDTSPDDCIEELNQRRKELGI